jgi:hypothetical protein
MPQAWRMSGKSKEYMSNNRGTCYTCYTVHRWRWLPVGAFRAKTHSDGGYVALKAINAGLLQTLRPVLANSGVTSI